VTDEHVLARVPARPELLRVLRAIASSVAARNEMSFDAVEEVRIIVDEASTLLLGFEAGDGAFLELSLEPIGRGLRGRIALEPASASSDPDGLLRTWPWRVLVGLCDDVAFVPEEAAIVFTKRDEAGTRP
jgi:hypothetical protein